MSEHMTVNHYPGIVCFEADTSNRTHWIARLCPARTTLPGATYTLFASDRQNAYHHFAISLYADTHDVETEDVPLEAATSWLEAQGLELSWYD